MLFQRINRTDPEKVFVIVYAKEALLQGRPAALTFDGTYDGLQCHLADAAADCTAVVGLADAAIAAGEFGLVQVYGYRADAMILGASNFSVDQNAHLAVSSVSSGCLTMSASIGACTGAQPNFIYASSASTTLTTAPTALGVFIRCM